MVEGAGVLLAAFGAAMVLEGLLPLIAPQRWRRVMAQLMQLKDGQLRFFGLVGVALGLWIVLISLD